MKAKAEVGSASLEMIKWTGVALLVALAVAGNYFYSSNPLIYRALGVVVLLALAAGLFLTTQKGGLLINLAKESRIEIRKVVWPTRPETTQTTILVLAAVAVVAVLLWLIDSFWGWLIKTLVY